MTGIEPEIRLGDSLYINGVEYVVATIDTRLNLDGRSATLHCYDPLLTAQFHEDARKKREGVEKMLKVADLALDEGSHD